MQIGNAGVKKEEDLRSPGAMPGIYHVMVQDVDETEAVQKYKSIIVTFAVLAGTIPGQEKKTIREFFSVVETALWRLDLLAIVLGLKAPGEVKDISFEAARGRQLVIEVVEEEYEGRKRKRISRSGFWSLTDPSVKDVPRDKVMETHAGVESGAAVSGVAGAGSSGSGGGGKWGKL